MPPQQHTKVLVTLRPAKVQLGNVFESFTTSYKDFTAVLLA